MMLEQKAATALEVQGLIMRALVLADDVALPLVAIHLDEALTALASDAASGSLRFH